MTEERTRKDVIKDIDSLINELINIDRDYLTINTGWVLSIKGAGVDVKKTLTSVIPSDNLDRISMAGLVKNAEIISNNWLRK